ncbi:MAG: hypothetical protein ACRDS0_21460 [Pseudonocardiaceae bacterium]
MSIQVNVIAASYGGLRNGDKDNSQAVDVKAALQNALSNALKASPHGIVTINNQNMGGDPAPGVLKHFGAIVEVDGTRYAFACEENQTINFT